MILKRTESHKILLMNIVIIRSVDAYANYLNLRYFDLKDAFNCPRNHQIDTEVEFF